MKIKAAVLNEKGKPQPYFTTMPLKVEEVYLSTPLQDEVLIKVASGWVVLFQFTSD